MNACPRVGLVKQRNLFTPWRISRRKRNVETKCILLGSFFRVRRDAGVACDAIAVSNSDAVSNSSDFTKATYVVHSRRDRVEEADGQVAECWLAVPKKK
jgi:hypothetical protein